MLRSLSIILLTLSCTGPVEVQRVITFERQDHWPAPSDFSGVRSGMLLTTNNGDDSISVLDSASGQELFRAPMGLFPMQLEGPHHLALAPQNTHLYIPISNYVPGAGSGPHGSHGTGRVPGYLLKINAANLLLEAQVVVDRSPGDVLISPDGSTVYVSHYDLVKIQEVLARGGTSAEMASTVAIVDTATMQRTALVPVCAGAHGMALSADANTLYVSCALSDEIGVVNLLTTPPSVTRFPVGAQAATPPDAVFEPYALTVNPANGKLLISNLKSRTIKLYDPANGMITDGPALDSSPMFGILVEDNTQFMVPLRESAKVELLDAETLQRIRPAISMTPDVCLNAHALELGTDGISAYLACEGDQVGPGSVVTITVPVFAVARSTPVGVYPDTVRIAP